MSTVKSINGSQTQTLNLQPSELRHFLQALRSDILKDVDAKLFKAIDGLVMELENRQTTKPNSPSDKQPTRSESRPEKLPAKEFVCRNSALTDLWEVTHLRSVYNICVSLLFLTLLNITVLYFFDSQKLQNDVSVVLWSFGEFHIVTLVWLCMMASILFVLYPAFQFWATQRSPRKKSGIYDNFFCWLFFVYQMSLLIIPARVIVVYNMPPVSSFIILAEQARLLMKTHAFVRENTSRALQFKEHQDGDAKDEKPYPSRGKLLYFLFAPTLVYRDTYPRTPYVRWNYVAWNFLQVLACIVGAYIPSTLFIVGTFKDTGIHAIPLVNFMFILAMSVFAGGLLMFLIFYGMFHCWLNAFAEMLRFGDRMFYQDWWNCTSFAKYYRAWNMVVYDWLYSYIYRDMYTIFGRSRVGAMLVVFLISAVIHEYILAICFKFVFPLLFFLFSSFGVLLVFVTRRRTSGAWNVFLWIGMFQGWGLLTVFYSMEWYARINCPRTQDTWLDYVIPRSFTCHVIEFPS